MIKYVFLFLTVSVILFVSCSKVDEDDRAPVISEVKINQNDTIRFNNEIITFNRTGAGRSNKDTVLIIGRSVILSAIFTDNVALSTYKVSIDSMYKNPAEWGVDTAFTAVKVGMNFAGLDRTQPIEVKRREEITIPTFITRPNLKDKAKTDTLTIREGYYSLRINCLDLAGNEAEVKYRVRLLYRKTLYDESKTWL